MILLNDLADIIGFGVSGVSGTKMTFKVRTKTWTRTSVLWQWVVPPS